jgi:hypothetical protein
MMLSIGPTEDGIINIDKQDDFVFAEDTFIPFALEETQIVKALIKVVIPDTHSLLLTIEVLDELDTVHAAVHSLKDKSTR